MFQRCEVKLSVTSKYPGKTEASKNTFVFGIASCTKEGSWSIMEPQDTCAGVLQSIVIGPTIFSYSIGDLTSSQDRRGYAC